jgi:hypothetical protein
MSIVDGNALIDEIARPFDQATMPPRERLPFHRGDCNECWSVADELEQFREAWIGIDAIRLIHQELSHLSAEA